MSSTNTHHQISFGYYTLVWITLIALTALTVAVAGINLGEYTLVIAMLIAAVKSAFVINIFMHVKFDELIFKVFFGVTLVILLIVFVFTAFDVFYR